MRMFFVVIALLVVGIILDSLFIVTQFQQALVLEFGKVDHVEKKPGLHFKTPMVQNVVKYDNRLLDLNAKPNEVIDKDQKPLIVDAFVKYKISDPLKFYQTVKSEALANQRLNTFLDASLRQVMGNVSIGTLLTGERSNVMSEIKDIVTEKGKNIGLLVMDVRIMRADFPTENSQRIYDRMKTEREREAKEFRAQGAEEAQIITSTADKERTILLAQAERDAQIIKGTADAEATKIFANAFSRDAEFFGFYRAMQSYRRSISSEDTRMVIAPNSDFMKYMKDMNAR